MVNIYIFFSIFWWFGKLRFILDKLLTSFWSNLVKISQVNKIAAINITVLTSAAKIIRGIFIAIISSVYTV